MALQSTTALASITLQAASSEIIFSTIPNIYRDLIVISSAIGSGSNRVDIELNNDTVRANYNRVFMRGDGSNRQSTSFNENAIFGIDASGRTLSSIYIIDYSASDKHKTMLYKVSDHDSEVLAGAMRWGNSAVVNQLALKAIGTTFAAGSSFSLYGRIS